MFPTTTQDDLPTFANGYKPPAEIDVDAVAEDLLSKVEQITAENDGDGFAALFLPFGQWKDTLAYTRDLRTFSCDRIAQAANDTFPVVQVRSMKLSMAYPPKLDSVFPDVQLIVIHLDSETSIGQFVHIVRLAYDNKAQQWKVWSYFTTLGTLHGFPLLVGDHRPTGKHNDTVSYATRREQQSSFESSTPDVLVVGLGHNGLATAAYLQAYGLKALCIGREERIGDNWRKRYDSLSLHDPIVTNHLPFLSFPSSWPMFPPAGKLANWLETYADALELNVWTRTTLDPTKSRFEDGKWHVTVLRTLADGTTTTREIAVSHIILATGLSGGLPRLPTPVEGQDSWKGEIFHSSQVQSGKAYADKKVLVVGAASSANDLAMDIANHGGHPTILQRSPTFVMSIENGVLRGVKRLAATKMSTEEFDYGVYSVPLPLAKPCYQRFTKFLAYMDRDLLSGLNQVGFKTWGGFDDTGFVFLGIARGGGVYYDTGACRLILNGKINVIPGEIESFNENKKVTFNDGTSEEFDAVVFATGYTGYKDSVAGLLGEKYAKDLKSIGGFDADGEIAGIARECGIPNVYYSIGALQNARWFGKIIALQVIMEREGILGQRYTRESQERLRADVIANGVAAL